MGTQVYSNEGPHPFSEGDNNEIAKIQWNFLKIFFSRATGPISIKLGAKNPWLEEFQVSSNKKLCPIPRGDNYKIVKIH